MCGKEGAGENVRRAQMNLAFLVVLFLGFVDLIVLSGNLFFTAMVNGIPVGPKKYEVNHPNLLFTFALLIISIRCLYEKPMSVTKLPVFLSFLDINTFWKHHYFPEIMPGHLTLYYSMNVCSSTCIVVLSHPLSHHF